MANTTPIFGWIYTDPRFSAAVDAMLDGKYPETSANHENKNAFHFGRIGSSNVVIHRLSESSRPTDITRIAQNMITSFHSLKAILITGFGYGLPSNDLRLGDLAIGPLTTRCESDINKSSILTPNIVQYAANILEGEVGADGRWLSEDLSSTVLNLPDLAKSTQSPGGSLSDYPHLIYGSASSGTHNAEENKLEIQLKSSNKVIGCDIIAPGLEDLPIPLIIILGISNFVGNAESNDKKGYTAANGASYGKELIQVMASNPTNRVPDLKNTEKLISPRTTPKLPPFPLHQYPKYGDATLLVVPTENTSKRKLLQEAFKQRAHKDTVLHTITIASDSGVGEQPYNEAGITGAHNRISNALLRLDAPDYQHTLKDNQIGTIIVASIENFIQTDNNNNNDIAHPPADYGLVVIHNATTHQTTACISHGVTVPPAYVTRARRFGFDDRDPNHGRVVVGQILAAHVPGLDRANWQEVLAGHSRYDLLLDAIMRVEIPW